MKLLHIDIETSPNIAYVWGLFKQNVGLNQIVESSRVLCVAAKWEGKDKVIFHSERDKGGHRGMIEKVWKLLDEADAVIHYNGQRFDVPTLNKEFLLYRMGPASPFKQIDLLQTMRSNFRLVSNKLDYVTKFLGFEGKMQHEGFTLWVDCMAGNKAAWKRMKEYNIQDVNVMQKAYHELLPWIRNHPNYALYVDTDRPVCPNCGGNHLHKRGTYKTNVAEYQRYACAQCGTHVRERYQTQASKDRAKNVMTRCA